MEKQKTETVLIGGHVPVTVWEAVRAIAQARGIKLSHILKEALESWLKRKGSKGGAA